MNKRFKYFFTSMLIMVMMLVNLGNHPSVISAASKPELFKKSALISVDESLELKFKNKIKGSKDSWSSSNKKIATVSSKGVVKGVNVGTATIYCNVSISSKKYKLRCKITVEKFKKIPLSYTGKDENPGTIEKLSYNTKTYDSKNKILTKYVNVYLPNGYDQKATSKKYNIFYLMHGGGENVDTLFAGAGKTSTFMKIIDNMIDNGEIDPLIIVTPTFYNSGNNDAMALVKNFNQELVNDIIPAVEGKYNTYAPSTSPKDLIATRSHRAFGGFSMGSACTWYTFINCLDYFEYFMPFSGDSWALGQGAGGSQPQKTAEMLAEVIKESGYNTNEFNIFSATGTVDFAEGNLTKQINAMKELTDTFTFSDNFAKGNLHYTLKIGGSHTWGSVYQYIYNYLPFVFNKEISLK